MSQENSAQNFASDNVAGQTVEGAMAEMQAVIDYLKASGAEHASLIVSTPCGVRVSAARMLHEQILAQTQGKRGEPDKWLVQLVEAERLIDSYLGDKPRVSVREYFAANRK